MKLPLKTIVILVTLAGVGLFGFQQAHSWWKNRSKTQYREAEVARGDVTLVISSAGTIQPEHSVQVGAVVSGPILRLYAYYNDEVEKDQLLAEIDPRIYDAAVARDRAALATRKAEVDRVEAQLKQAVNDEHRADELREIHADYISEAELDRVECNRVSLEAQLQLAKAAVEQAEANLKNSLANLEYTKIKSPVSGIVIDRKIDEGQALAATFQTPELFVVAPNMREKMHIFASVDEADIGLIRQAQQQEQKVHFTVDAYPDDLFEGTIHQVRMNPTTTQNVVTYPVVVESANPELKLLPGMTANLSFEIEEHKDVLKIPNAALRFYPKSHQVRPEDKKVLEGLDEDQQGEEEDNASPAERPATERVEANRKRNRRHVWVVEKELLKAVEVELGLSDYKWTELVSGKLEEGQKLVTGVGAPDS